MCVVLMQYEYVRLTRSKNVTYPAFFVKEGLSAVHRAEGPFPQFAVDHDPVSGYFPFV